MKRKQSLIGGLDRILSVREASDQLSISVDELLKYYAGQREISLRNLLKGSVDPIPSTTSPSSANRLIP